ncbi:MAG: cytochrome b/b6 domain-containing protein [Cypionkella sp.]
MTRAAPVPHSQATRIAHAGLSLAVGVELLSGIIMRAPEQNFPANAFFEVHIVSALAVTAFALAFWGIILVRKTGTRAGLLFPWSSVTRTKAFLHGFRAYVTGMRAARPLPYDEASPCAATLNGLGLFVVTALGATGFASDLAKNAGFARGPAVLIAADLHQVMADLVWAYLLAHGLMALIHHYGLDKGLAEMWSFGRSPKTEATETEATHTQGYEK